MANVKAVDLDAIRDAIEAPDHPLPAAPPAASTGAARIADRVEGIVKEMSSETAEQFTALRNQIDAVLRQNDARRQALTEAIIEYAQFTQLAIESKVIIADALAQIETRFASGMAATPRLVKS